MKLLLTSGGVTNPSIRDALIDLLGKPSLARAAGRARRAAQRDVQDQRRADRGRPAVLGAGGIGPYIAHALDVFGEGRVAFGSDWPVVLLAGGHRIWVEALESLTAYLSPAQQRKLWSENARRFYRLDRRITTQRHLKTPWQNNSFLIFAR